MNISNIILIATTICVGLMAGLFYSYSCSVMPGLKRVSDREFVAAMQSINRAIQNPVFFISFFGSLILLPVCAWLNYSGAAKMGSLLLLAAMVVYIIGAFGVTALGNIPLNNELDKFDIANAAPATITAQRNLFEARWNSLNTVRTLSSVISFILLVVACVQHFSEKIKQPGL